MTYEEFSAMVGASCRAAESSEASVLDHANGFFRIDVSNGISDELKNKLLSLSDPGAQKTFLDDIAGEMEAHLKSAEEDGCL